jgi:hypothetical protein
MASAIAAGSPSARRVVAAHDALQLGELADHVGQQVGLGQQARRGLRAPGLVAPQHLARSRARAPHALDAFALAAELVVVDHLRQACGTRPRASSSVLLEEELRVGQARAHHAFVAGDDALGSATCMLRRSGSG